MTGTDDLDAIIAASPVRVLPELVRVIRQDHDAEVRMGSGDLCVVRDDVETTLVTSSADRLAAARADGRPDEGPFAVLRLEISVPFEGPGFIAAATAACAAVGINTYVISTFSFDYVLVAATDREAALVALTARGFPIA